MLFPHPASSFSVPLIDGDGGRWVGACELVRCAQARDAGIAPHDLRALGDPDDQLTISEAARLAGVTSRYLRGLAHHHHKYRDAIERQVADGQIGRATGRERVCQDVYI